MPDRPPRICRAPACRKGTTHKSGYCEEHQANQKSWSNRKGSGRGGRPWRRLREQVMNRDNWVCQVCLENGRVTPATQVDHIIPKSRGGSDSPSNLRAICGPCHKVKTAQESAEARNRTM